MIIIYGTRSCAFCDKAKAYARKWYGEFKFFDVGITQYNNFLLEKNVSTNILPQIFEDDRYVGTYYEFVKETQIKISEISEEAGTN